MRSMTSGHFALALGLALVTPTRLRPTENFRSDVFGLLELAGASTDIVLALPASDIFGLVRGLSGNPEVGAALLTPWASTFILNGT